MANKLGGKFDLASGDAVAKDRKLGIKNMK